MTQWLPRITTMRTLAIITVIVTLAILSSLTHTNSWVNHAFSDRQPELQYVHEQVADVFWILLLCSFSILVRWRKKRSVRQPSRTVRRCGACVLRPSG